MLNKAKNIITKLEGMVMIVIVFFPYITIENTSYTIIGFSKILKAADMQTWVTENGIFTDNPEFLRVSVLLQIYVLIGVALVAVIKSIIRLFGKKVNLIVTYLSFVLCLAALVLNVSGYGMMAMLRGVNIIAFPIIPLVWTAIVFFLDKFSFKERKPESEDFEKENMNQDKAEAEKEKLKLEKEDITQENEESNKENVTREKVNISKALLRCFGKIYKNLWKEIRFYYLLVGMCIGGFLVLVTIGSTISNMNASETAFLAVGEVIKDAMVMFAVVFGVMLVNLIVYYFEKNIQVMNSFYMLGMKKEHRTLFLAGLFGSIYMISLLAGCLFGYLFLWVIKNIVHYWNKTPLDFQVTGLSLGIVIGIWTVVFVFVMLLSYDNWSMKKYINTTKEKVPEKHLNIKIVLSGLAFIVLLHFYGQLLRFENKLILIGMLVTIYFLIRYCTAKVIGNEDKKLKRLLKRHRMNIRSRTLSMQSTINILMLISALFLSNLQVSSISTLEDSNKLFPYDVVCYAYGEDEEQYGQIAEKYGLEMLTFPMCRVSNMDITDEIETRGSTPIQGQQIGISESTYHRLKSYVDSDYVTKDLGLDADGKSVYIVHQQDGGVRAQPLDYWLWSKQPLLHIGQPCSAIGYTNAVMARKEDIGYSYREIAGEEISSLIGVFDCTGKQENVVVFSDEYFNEALQLWKTTNQYTGRPISKEMAEQNPDLTKQGPSALILFQGLKESDADQLKKDLQKIEEKHTDDLKYNSVVKNVYYKSNGTSDIEQMREAELSIGWLQTILFAALVVMLILVEIITTGEELEKRNVLLKYLGMDKKRRFGIIRSDLLSTIHMSEWIAIIVSIGLLLATFQARMYDMITIKNICGVMIWIAVILLLVVECAVRIVIDVWMHKMER